MQRNNLLGGQDIEKSALEVEDDMQNLNLITNERKEATLNKKAIFPKWNKMTMFGRFEKINFNLIDAITLI